MTASVLDLGDSENRFSPDWLQRVHSFLDGVEGALVTTGGGKFYSNGLDLEWLSAHADEAPKYVAEESSFVARSSGDWLRPR